jgi:hypothetical protein
MPNGWFYAKIKTGNKKRNYIQHTNIPKKLTPWSRVLLEKLTGL